MACSGYSVIRESIVGPRKHNAVLKISKLVTQLGRSSVQSFATVTEKIKIKTSLDERLLNKIRTHPEYGVDRSVLGLQGNGLNLFNDVPHCERGLALLSQRRNTRSIYPYISLNTQRKSLQFIAVFTKFYSLLKRFLYHV
jgi:hypothetical protein